MPFPIQQGQAYFLIEKLNEGAGAAGQHQSAQAYDAATGKADGDGTGINEDAYYPEGHPAAAALGEYPADGIIGAHAQPGAHVEGAGKAGQYHAACQQHSPQGQGGLCKDGQWPQQSIPEVSDDTQHEHIDESAKAQVAPVQQSHRDDQCQVEDNHAGAIAEAGHSRIAKVHAGKGVIAEKAQAHEHHGKAHDYMGSQDGRHPPAQA